MNNFFINSTTDKEELIFCRLYATYKNRLIYFAVKFVKSKDLAEDIVQEAFISIWLNRKNLDEDQSIESYLFTTVYNKILNQLKNLDNEIRLKETLMQNAIDYPCETENKITERDLKNIFSRLLSTLTPQQQRIFIMSREENLSHKEIASQLGISIYTVNQHITEALQTLRVQIAKHPEIYRDCFVLILFYMNSWHN